MWNTTRTIKTEDFYKTTITEAIVGTWDIDFTVATPPVNTRGFIIINPTSTSLRERMYYHDVIWSRVYVKWINRPNPKTHLITAWIQINDTANIFNYLSEISSTTFFVEKTWSLAATVWGWPLLKDNVEVVVLDTSVTFTDNTTNYICYNETTNTITSQTSEQDIVMAEVTTASWVITSIKYKNYKMSIIVWAVWPTWPTWPIWPTWPTWPTGSIDNAPTNTQQTIDDNQVITWTTVTTDDTTFIKVTYVDWTFTRYSLTEIITWDANDEVYSNTPLVWIFWATWITYSTGLFVNKTTWYTNFTGSPMYKDQDNNVTAVNTYNDTSIFKWQAIFTYFLNAANITEFDANDWTKQRMSWTGWWAKTLDFTNLLAWNTMILAINVSWWTVTLDEWTATWIWVDWLSKSFSYFSIWWDTYPLSLVNWTHIFAFEVFSDAIHFSYLWTSVAF